VNFQDLFTNSIKRVKKNDPLDIQLLIQRSLSLTKEKFWINKNKKITDRAGLQKFYRYLNRLIKGEPVQYILKKTEFYSHSLYIKNGVLIPRPETEIIVEEVLKLVKEGHKILDIGAGSGAISIALAKNSNCHITALETSLHAIPVLKRNIIDHKLNKKIKIIKADLFPDNNDKLFDIIVSNPPYISEKDWEELDNKVKQYEPRLALIGGKKGTEIIEKIVFGSTKYLKKNACLLIEIGFDQYETVPEIFRKNGFKDIRVISDYSGIGRVVIGRV